MRLALASDWFLPRRGGIELQIRDLALALQAKGHEVEVITPLPGPDVVDGIRVHRLGVPRLPGAGIIFTPGAFERIGDRLRAGNYDVVHVHFGIIAPAAYGFAAVAQGMGIPTVATFHSVLKHFEVPQWLLGGVLNVRNWRVKWSGVSSVVAASIRPLVGDQPVEILPNGVDAEWWKRNIADCGLRIPEATTATRNAGGAVAPDPQPPTLRAVAVMRLHPRKRPVPLVRTVAEVNRRLSGSGRLHLEIIGDGGELRRLHRVVEHEGLRSAVTLSGWKSREEIRRSLHEADLFVMPSRLEAFGIAALEARCAGVPVVAMREAGARDFVRDGVDGVLVGSDGELAETLVRVCQDAELLATLRLGALTPPAKLAWPDVVAAHERSYLAAGESVRRGRKPATSADY